MVKESIILQVEKILETKDDRAIKAAGKLINELVDIGSEHEYNAVWSALQDFLNYETLNYVSDETLEEIQLEK